ncbi:hypothetical protein F5B20DRAFT_585817 [Whalleya microplaca]|nr:hypothetical protein F5B20DRAFT_585817 [Whalleya microplaca]
MATPPDNKKTPSTISKIAKEIKNVVNIPSYLRQRRALRNEAYQAEYLALLGQAVAGPVPLDDLYRLAFLEGVYLNPRGRKARFHDDELGDGLVARFHRLDEEYYFLGADGLFWKSTHARGRGKLVKVPEGEVDEELRRDALPYRQLCTASR